MGSKFLELLLSQVCSENGFQVCRVAFEPSVFMQRMGFKFVELLLSQVC